MLFKAEERRPLSQSFDALDVIDPLAPAGFVGRGFILEVSLRVILGIFLALLLLLPARAAGGELESDPSVALRIKQTKEAAHDVV